MPNAEKRETSIRLGKELSQSHSTNQVFPNVSTLFGQVQDDPPNAAEHSIRRRKSSGDLSHGRPKLNESPGKPLREESQRLRADFQCLRVDFCSLRVDSPALLSYFPRLPVDFTGLQLDFFSLHVDF